MIMDDIDYANEVITAYAKRIIELEQKLAERETAKTPAKLVLDQMRRIGELEKQIVIARKALERIADPIPEDPWAHDIAKDALENMVQDLAGLVVCDAKPVMKVIRNEAGQVVAQNGDGGYFRSIDYVGKSFYLAKELGK